MNRPALSTRLAAALAVALASMPLYAQDEMGDQPTAAEPAAPAAQNAPAAGANEAQPAQAPANFASEEERLSYALGYLLGNEYGRNEIALNPDVFIDGLRSGLNQEQPKMNQEQLQQTLANFQRRMQARQVQRFQEQAEQGTAYLAENAKKEGVKTTASGLQYEVVKEGQGESPTREDEVRVHYRGTFVNGQQFDSSYDRGEPAQFPVTGVIPGWTEALLLMKPGAHYKLAIPSDLAYGPEGRPPAIPPNAVLLFDVELLEVVK